MCVEGFEHSLSEVATRTRSRSLVHGAGALDWIHKGRAVSLVSFAVHLREDRLWCVRSRVAQLHGGHSAS